MNNSLRKSREVSDNAKGYLLVSGCIVDVWQSMRLLTAGSLVRAQLEEPDEQNIKSEPLVFKSDVLFFCLNIDLSRVYGDLLDNSVLNTKVKTV